MKKQTIIFSWIGGIFLLTIILMKIGLISTTSSGFIVVQAIGWNLVMIIVSAILEVLISSIKNRKLSFNIITFLSMWSVFWIIMLILNLLR